MSKKQSTPWIFWPFMAIWSLLAALIEITGRLVAVILGVAVALVGIVLTLTGIGAILGIPLGLLGMAIVFRGIF